MAIPANALSLLLKGSASTFNPTAGGAPAVNPSSDQLQQMLQGLWMSQYGAGVPVGPLAGGQSWFSNAPNPDMGQQGTLNPTTLQSGNLSNVPSNAAWLFQGLPGYGTIAGTSKGATNTSGQGMKAGGTIIPARYQSGGVATDENDNPASYQPERGTYAGLEATAPDVAYQDGTGYVPRPPRPPRLMLPPDQQAMAFQQAMAAMQRPSYFTPGGGSFPAPTPMPSSIYGPIYDAQGNLLPPQQQGQPAATPAAQQVPRLTNPQSELAGYQEGGTTDEKEKKTAEIEPGAGGARYLYVDPSARAYGPQGYNPMTGGYDPRIGMSSDEARRIADRGEEARRFEDTAYDLGQAIRNSMDSSALPGMAGRTSEPISFADGGQVQYPGIAVDPTTGLPVLGASNAPRQQASAVAGEPAKKQPPKQQQPQHYEFGRERLGPDEYESPVAMERMAQQQTPKLEQAMAKGGAIKSFLQHLAKGGIVKTPDDLIMAATGYKYGLSARDAAKPMRDRANPVLPP